MRRGGPHLRDAMLGCRLRHLQGNEKDLEHPSGRGWESSWTQAVTLGEQGFDSRCIRYSPQKGGGRPGAVWRLRHFERRSLALVRTWLNTMCGLFLPGTPTAEPPSSCGTLHASHALSQHCCCSVQSLSKLTDTCRVMGSEGGRSVDVLGRPAL